MKKPWFLPTMKYSLNGKDIMALMEYTTIVYSHNKKDMSLWKVLFQSGNNHGKR